MLQLPQCALCGSKVLESSKLSTGGGAASGGGSTPAAPGGTPAPSTAGTTTTAASPAKPKTGREKKGDKAESKSGEGKIGRAHV